MSLSRNPSNVSCPVWRGTLSSEQQDASWSLGKEKAKEQEFVSNYPALAERESQQTWGLGRSGLRVVARGFSVALMNSPSRPSWLYH